MPLPDHAAIFVSTAKAGTNTMYAVLSKHYGGRLSGGFHATQLPARASCVFTTCRNPYTRALSGWSSLTQRPGSKGKSGQLVYESIKRRQNPDDFDLFCEALADGWIASPIAEPQHRWHDKFHPDTVLHLENLADEFRALPFSTGAPEAWPVQNDSRAHYTLDRLTPRAIDAIRRWAGPDFERFGYDPDDIPHEETP